MNFILDFESRYPLSVNREQGKRDLGVKTSETMHENRLREQAKELNKQPSWTR